LGFNNWTWVFGDGEVSLEQVSSHTYTQAGVYTVELFLTDSSQTDCTIHIVQEIEITGAVGVEHDAAVALTLYPNPCQDFVVLETSNQERGTYQIFNTNGEEVGRGNLFDQRTKFSTTELPSGIYIVSLTTETGAMKKKLIIN